MENFKGIIHLAKQGGYLADDGKPATLPPATGYQLRDSQSALYTSSIRYSDNALYGLASAAGEKRLVVIAPKGGVPDEVKGETASADGFDLIAAPLSWESYRALRERFPFIAPISLRSRRTTIGCGDRLGKATPGHIRAAAPFDVAPVLAQQSIRELTLTRRTYPEVVADAAFGVFQEGYKDGYGADGDHLKTIEDIDIALDAEMPMITLDLTEVMNPEPSRWSDARIEEAFGLFDDETKQTVSSGYSDKHFDVGGTEIHLGRLDSMRCALIYWKALDFAAEVDAHLRSRRGDAYDLEISVDETTAPTIPSHHLFIAKELARRGVTVNSLAPRFIGEFQKGIDYIGDLTDFERQFEVHCRIARAYGNYKISIHSGSDKFAVYPAIGRHTDLRVHVKTAGTSWLEAVRTVSTQDPALYRLLHEKAFAHFGDATKLYHITADLSLIAALDSVGDAALRGYLDQNESRQLIHITYGGLLNDPDVRERFFTFLDEHEVEHYETVRSHIERHLKTLGLESSSSR